MNLLQTPDQPAAKSNANALPSWLQTHQLTVGLAARRSHSQQAASLKMHILYSLLPPIAQDLLQQNCLLYFFSVPLLSALLHVKLSSPQKKTPFQVNHSRCLAMMENLLSSTNSLWEKLKESCEISQGQGGGCGYRGEFHLGFFPPPPTKFCMKGKEIRQRDKKVTCISPVPSVFYTL